MDIEWVDGNHIMGLDPRGGGDFTDGAVWNPTR